MKFGSKPAIEPKTVRFEESGHTVDVTHLPGKKPHFVIECEGHGKWDRVVVDPAQVLKDDTFRPDGEKLRKFYEKIDGEVLDTIREQLQEQRPPEDEGEREVYYATLALFHMPTSQSDLKEVHKKMNKGEAA